MRTDLPGRLRCAACQAVLKVVTDPAAGPALRCEACARRYPIVDGIPRFVTEPADQMARRTQASFGYEWTHFNDWSRSGETNFQDYFAGVDLSRLGSAIVLDAGCGMGRHARQMAPYCDRLVAMDFSRAIDQAARNTADVPNVDCVQADLLALPFADSMFDFVYSLGVLHHLAETDRALHGLVQKLKPGGAMRIYLYWKRHGFPGRLLQLVTLARRLTTRTPFPILRALCWWLSAVLFVFVVLPYRALSRMGLSAHHRWPLFVYSKYPFNVLYNDQFDRFSAPIEKRYDPDEIRALLERAGLRDVRVRECYGWLADGMKPS